jgi:hypothetical protein
MNSLTEKQVVVVFLACLFVNLHVVWKAGLLNIHFKESYLFQIGHKVDVLISCHQISHETFLELTLGLQGHGNSLL